MTTTFTQINLPPIGPVTVEWGWEHGFSDVITIHSVFTDEIKWFIPNEADWWERIDNLVWATDDPNQAMHDERQATYDY